MPSATTSPLNFWKSLPTALEDVRFETVTVIKRERERETVITKKTEGEQRLENQKELYRDKYNMFNVKLVCLLATLGASVC